MLICLIYPELLINVLVIYRVRNSRHWGLQNENSSIFRLKLGVVINLALLAGRAREGRSDRHRNTIPRQVIILLRAPNLWPGMFRYPLNHPSFHFIHLPLLYVFPSPSFFSPHFYKCSNWKIKSRSHCVWNHISDRWLTNMFATSEQPV